MSYETSESGIYIRLAKESEVDGISEFLEKHFSPGNPMELAYIYKQDEPTQDEHVKDDEDPGFILKAIIDEHVLVAVEVSTTTLVGVLIADTIDSTSKGHLITPTATLSGSDGNPADDIPNFLAYINAKSNVCERLGVNKSFHIEIVGVHQNYRKQQIAKKLFESAIELAKSKNCQAVSVDCVNIYMSAIAEKLGMDCISIVTYDEYSDHLGKCIFVPIPPHMEIKTFVKKL